MFSFLLRPLFAGIPSKSLIASSKAAHSITKASEFGISIEGEVKIDMKAIKSRVQSNIQHIYEEDDSPQAMKKLGIDTIAGSAKFIQENVIEVTNQNGKDEVICTVTAKDGVLICTGARPNIPTIPGLDSVQYLTYEDAFSVEEVPKSLTVVGGGPIGVELAQAYSRLGAKVTIIADKLLPKVEPEAKEAIQRVFESEGITIVSSRLTSVQANEGRFDGKKSSAHIATCQNGETYNGDTLLLATGRKPSVMGMNLHEIGVEMNEVGGIKVDDKLQTSMKGIYAAGDCTGLQQFTHYAGYQGAVGARNILLPLSDPGLMKFVPGTTFTDPQVAAVGMTEEDAVKEYGEGKVGVAFQAIKETDRGICDNVKEGFIKVVYLKRGLKILGACIMSPVAGETIAEISVAMKAGMPFDQLATVIHTYPSHAFALQAIAAELYYEKLVKLKPILNFLKRLGL